MSFTTLGLDSSLLATLTALGYTEPTAVQALAIPAALAGGDLLVSSQTGSGKTAAFILPGLTRLAAPAPALTTGRGPGTPTTGRGPGTGGSGPRMLVLAPTRELAMQVQKA